MAANHQKGSGYMVNWLGAENMGPEMDINDCQWTLDMKASFKRFFVHDLCPVANSRDEGGMSI